MNVELRFFANFREAVGQKTLEHEFEDGATVGEILRSLESEYEGLAGNLLENGDLKPQINVLKNGREVLHIEGLETTLDEGDTLSVFPPVAGGR
ncbi:MAG: ubiquitin-like small modifier protein 1 [Haloplanus sp.]